MHPEQIKAALRMKGVTPSALADKLGVARSTVSVVISGRAESARIKANVAEIIGLPIEELWPTRQTHPPLRRTREAMDAARNATKAKA